jgi:hypothetical protein
VSENGTSVGIFEGYKGEEVPLVSYAALAVIFNAVFVFFLLLARATGRPVPERVGVRDIILFGVATHKLSWLISRDSVTTPLRAPFTEFEEMESPTNVQEKPRGTGFQKSIGELLTCQFCVGQWVAAFFAYGLVLFPAATRFIGTVFAVVAVSDHLHQTYKALMDRA